MPARPGFDSQKVEFSAVKAQRSFTTQNDRCLRKQGRANPNRSPIASGEGGIVPAMAVLGMGRNPIRTRAFMDIRRSFSRPGILPGFVHNEDP